MTPSTAEICGTALFGVAVLHTFSAKRIERWAHRLPEGTVARNVVELAGEVETVFGFWAGVLYVALLVMDGAAEANAYLRARDFTEPAFVFAVMTIAATRPVLHLARVLIAAVARVLPGREDVTFFASALVVGPLLGSFITEPAAMTVTALLLQRRYYRRGLSERLKYAALGVLFVNISIGGTLSHFAAPPVVIVASKWGWGLAEMMGTFGWKAAIAVIANAAAVTMLFRRELAALPATGTDDEDDRPIPWWLVGAHCVFLAAVVVTGHHLPLFLGVLLFFLGAAKATHEYQDELRLREALLVGFFLAGLVVLGGLQSWWLRPVLASLGEGALFLGAAGLTAITDNAALTYLGSQVPELTEPARVALVAGAVAGGGLTVIANAPNPAGYGILRHDFADGSIGPMGLFAAALGPTAVGMACLWWLPSL